MIPRTTEDRIVVTRAREYGTVTPALAQVCKTLSVGAAIRCPQHGGLGFPAAPITDATVQQ